MPKWYQFKQIHGHPSYILRHHRARAHSQSTYACHHCIRCSLNKASDRFYPWDTYIFPLRPTDDRNHVPTLRLPSLPKNIWAVWCLCVSALVTPFNISKSSSFVLRTLHFTEVNGLVLIISLLLTRCVRVSQIFSFRRPHLACDVAARNKTPSIPCKTHCRLDCVVQDQGTQTRTMADVQSVERLYCSKCPNDRQLLNSWKPNVTVKIYAAVLCMGQSKGWIPACKYTWGLLEHLCHEITRIICMIPMDTLVERFGNPIPRHRPGHYHNWQKARVVHETSNM